MEFIDENTDFINFSEEQDDTYVATCHECGHQFTLNGDEEASSCPNCDINFI